MATKCIICKLRERTAKFPTCQPCRNYGHRIERQVANPDKGLGWLFEHDRKLETNVARIHSFANINAKGATLLPIEDRSELMAYRGIEPRDSKGRSNVVPLVASKKGKRSESSKQAGPTRARA